MIFLKNVFNGSEYCSALLETVSLRVANRNFRDFGFFNVDLKRRNFPSARNASAANAIDSDIDMFNRSSISTDAMLHFGTVSKQIQF